MELTVTALHNETPEQHMSRLGEMSRKVMEARINAGQRGLEAILSRLRQVDTQITAEQERLLVAHPELVMMAFNGR